MERVRRLPPSAGATAWAAQTRAPPNAAADIVPSHKKRLSQTYKGRKEGRLSWRDVSVETAYGLGDVPESRRT